MFMIGGDLHIRPTAPEHRKDVFWKSQLDKFVWMLNEAGTRGCKFVILPGDVTDSPRTPYGLLSMYAGHIRANNIPILAVYGQHDLRYHVGKDNTPLNLLRAAGLLHILTNSQPFDTGTGLLIWGQGWKEEIPQPPDDPCIQNMLVMHKLTLQETNHWTNTEMATTSRLLLRKELAFDFFVCGDNHQQFVEKDEHNRMVINPGSFMRTRIDQVDHKPAVYILDTDGRTLEQIEIPILPINEVMDIDTAKKEKDKDEKIKAWVDSLSNDLELTDLDFDYNLEMVLLEVDVDQDLLDMIGEMKGGQRIKRVGGTEEGNRGGEGGEGKIRRPTPNTSGTPPKLRLKG